MADKFIDPVNGSDANSGDSPSVPRRTPPNAANDMTYKILRGTRLVLGSQWNWGTATNVSLTSYGEASAPDPIVTITGNSTNLINIQGDGIHTFRNISFEDCVSNTAGGVIGAGLVAATSRCAQIDVQYCAFRNIFRQAIRFGNTSTATASIWSRIAHNVFDGIGEDAIYGGALNLFVLHNKMRRLSQLTANGDGLGFIDADPVRLWFMYNEVDHSDVDSKHCVIVDSSTGAGQAIFAFNKLIGYGYGLSEPGSAHTVVNADCQAFVFGNEIRTAGLAINMAGVGSVVSGNRIWLSSYRPTAPSIAFGANGGRFINNGVWGPGKSVPGRCVVSGSSVATMEFRNNVMRGLQIAVQLDGAGTALTNGTNWFDDVAFPYLNNVGGAIAVDASDKDGDISPAVLGDMSLDVLHGTTVATLAGANPLALAGTYVEGVRLANGRLRPGYCPIGPYQAVLPRGARS